MCGVAGSRSRLHLGHQQQHQHHQFSGAVSVSDLLDISLGSDDVFTGASIGSSSLTSRQQQSAVSAAAGNNNGDAGAGAISLAGSIVGVDPASDMISRFVRVVEPPVWPNAQPCPMCLEELVYDVQNPSIALSRCQHLVHLQCLNELIISQQVDPAKSLYIECPVCGIVYGEKVGNQPAGGMTWKILQKSLPGHEGQNTIQIVYE